MTYPARLKDGAGGHLRPLFAILIAGTLLRVIAAAIIGPNADETYLAVASRVPDWGYVDHPPLAMWLAAMMRSLTGSDSFLVLRLPFILLFAGTTFFIWAVTDLLFGRATAAVAAAALSLTPMFSIYFGTFAITDGPYVFFLSAAAYCLARALFEENERDADRWWLAAGIACGLAMLSKYIAVLFPFGVGLFLLTQRRFRHWLLRPAPWAGLALAGLMTAPVLLWNARYDWVSFIFQGSRAESTLTFQPTRLIANLAVQAVYYFPPIWVGLVVTLAIGVARRSKSARAWLPTCLAIGPIAFFTLLWLIAADGEVDNRGFHWSAGGYLMLYPLYAALLQAREHRKRGRIRFWFSATATIQAILLTLYFAHLTTGWGQRFMPHQDRDPILAEQVSWDDLRSELSRRNLLDSSRYALAATRWESCARIEYSLASTMQVICEPGVPVLASPEGIAAAGSRSVILVSRSPDLSGRDAALAARFAAFNALGEVTIKHMGVDALKLWLFQLDGRVP